MTDKPKAVILLSGGLDSSTCLALAINQGYEPYGLSFDYGQRHLQELDAVEQIVHHYKINCLLQKIILPSCNSSLINHSIEVPKDQLSDQIPNTFVPGRNLLFLSYAVCYSQAIRSNNIFIGINSQDYSGYPDCRPEFIQAFQHTACEALGLPSGRLVIHRPLQNLSKSEIIQLGHSLQVPYHLTHSCYDPINGKACGHCDSCLLRKKGFEEANVPDPTVYV